MRSNERPETITRSHTNRRISAGETSTTARASPKRSRLIRTRFLLLSGICMLSLRRSFHVLLMSPRSVGIWSSTRFLRMQRFMSSGRPLGSRYRMPTGITLMVSIVENMVISSWRLRTSIKSAAMERNRKNAPSAIRTTVNAEPMAKTTGGVTATTSSSSTSMTGRR